ncbi:MAG: hypothetical protein GY832_38240 [Chloroflexi bacterium]|nr:hypothetical protein [Chloroflexota bacterium]
MNKTRAPKNRGKSGSTSDKEKHDAAVKDLNDIFEFTSFFGPSFTMPVLIVVFLIVLWFASLLFTTPTTRLRGLTVDENGQPVPSTFIVFKDNKKIAIRQSGTDVKTDEMCFPPRDYNYELTVPGDIIEPPQGRCRAVMVDDLKPGGAPWLAETTDGHLIVVQNLGSDPPSSYFEPSAGEATEPTGAKSLIQSSPFVRWSVILIVFFSLGLVFIRPRWQTITNLAARWLDTSRKGRALHKSSGTMRHNLNAHFNAGELHDLCFDLNIDYDSLPGEGKSDKARELVAHCRRHGRTQELVMQCSKLRPKVNWKDTIE